MENNTPICVITGANSGIGKQTAIELAEKGYYLILLVKDSDKSREAYDEIKSYSTDGQVEMIFTDLSAFDSIKRAVEEIRSKYQQLDILINNAGIYKRKKEMSADSHEMTLAVNYLAPYYLTRLLFPLIEKSPSARIINVTSGLYKNGSTDFESFYPSGKFEGLKTYADSKLLLVYFTYYLSELVSGKNITVNAVHPGVIATGVFRELPGFVNTLLRFFVGKPEKGARPVVYLATSPEVEKVTGKYFDKGKMYPALESVYKTADAKRLWNKTEDMINRFMPEVD